MSKHTAYGLRDIVPMQLGMCGFGAKSRTPTLMPVLTATLNIDTHSTCTHPALYIVLRKKS